VSPFFASLELFSKLQGVLLTGFDGRGGDLLVIRDGVTATAAAAAAGS
jgi:hypothetical protein